MLQRTLSMLMLMLVVIVLPSRSAFAGQYVVQEEGGSKAMVETRFGKWPLVHFDKGDQAGEICQEILRTLGGSSAAKINHCWREKVVPVFMEAHNIKYPDQQITLARALEIIDGGIRVGSLIAFPPDANILAKMAEASRGVKLAELEAQNLILRNTVKALRKTAIVAQARTARNEAVLLGQLKLSGSNNLASLQQGAGVETLVPNLEVTNQELEKPKVGMTTSAVTTFSIGNLTDIEKAFRYMSDSRIATYGLILFLVLVILLLALYIRHTHEERRIPKPGKTIKRKINGRTRYLTVVLLKRGVGEEFSDSDIHVFDAENPKNKDGVPLDKYIERLEKAQGKAEKRGS